MENLVEKLKELGFNSYEAKVYLALLKKYPSTGYEAAQFAGIPQSRAYDALKNLVIEKIAIATEDKPQKYIPVSPKELTKRYKRKFNSTLDYLEKKLPDVKENYLEPIHSVNGYENIIETIKDVINNSKRSIYVEIWKEDFHLIEENLRNAYDNGTDIKIVGYNGLKTNFGMVYSHPGAREIEASTQSRLIYLVADNEEGVFGKIQSNVIWTKNQDVTFLLKEFIVHDMYLLDVNMNFPEQLKYFYGNGFKRLKDKILTNDTNINIH